MSKPSNAAYLPSIDKTYSTTDQKLSLRNCIEGEAFVITGERSEFDGPNLCSLTIMTETGSCKQWPTNKAICTGGSKIAWKAGFWRSSSTTENFIECLYFYAWLGTTDPSNELTGKCATGY